MSYLVLARKYRPQSFEDLVGQNHVTQTLVNALAAGRVAHAYVFSGPRGCGKTTLARLLARALNCEQGPTATPCGSCAPCREISQGQSPDDVLEIDGASNRGIDQIRELRDTVKYAPVRCRYRVYIIDEAHQITEHGFNALLKTLEEPPPHAVFMMATTESQKIPGTILSRCQRFQLKPLPTPLIIERLKKITAMEKLSVDTEALADVARAAHGSLRDALSLLDQVAAYAPQGAQASDIRSLLGLLPREVVRKFLGALEQGSPQATLKAVQQAVEEGVDLHQLAEDLLEHYHRVLLWKSGASDLSDPEHSTLESQAQALTFDRLERQLLILSRIVDRMRRSESPRVTFELGALELTQRSLTVEVLLERLERLEAGLGPRPSEKPVPPPPVVAQKPPPEEELSPPATPPSPDRESQNPFREAWDLVLEDLGQTRPSLETFLRRAQWASPAPDVLELTCHDAFQKSSIEAQRAAIEEAIKKRWTKHVSLQIIVSAAAQAAKPPPPAPTLDEPPLELLVAPAPGPNPADDISDAGLKKVLEKFPGRVRKAAKPSDA